MNVWCAESLYDTCVKLKLLSWCLMSSDVIWHIRDKLWPMPKHGSIRKVYVCLAVTCHLHFWQNDRDFLRATVVTRGWNGYRNKSQHRKLTLEKKILPPFQQGFEPATFQSRVRRSNHWAIPAPCEAQSVKQSDMCLTVRMLLFLLLMMIVKLLWWCWWWCWCWWRGSWWWWWCWRRSHCKCDFRRNADDDDDVVSKWVFYAQSAVRVISGPNDDDDGVLRPVSR